MSRFVSAGTDEEPPERDEEWLKAQQELDANRLRKAEEEKQQDGKTLYDILQANKAAKQEAFEESIRLKNQFRSLDDDEVDFLDTVLESTRAKEAAIRKETDEQLDLFRRQQEEAERAAREEEQPGEGIQGDTLWHSGPRRKRKALEKDSLKNVKVRRVSSSTGADRGGASSPVGSISSDKHGTKDSSLQVQPLKDHNEDSQISVMKSSSQSPLNTEKAAKPVPSTVLGLSAYSSDDE